MSVSDSIRLDTAAGQQELALLLTMKVGDVRKGTLFPAIPGDVTWTCVTAAEYEWSFEGRFFGVFVGRINIVMVKTALVLTVEEGVVAG